MAELPSGTVTFLFTDIEGSTALLKKLREAYDGALGDHQRLLREAAAAHRGTEIDTQGDSFFFAFARAGDAVAAAAAAQRALAAHAWPVDGSVHVRMALHTGEPRLGGERYVGLGVHRGARICAAGHGGQVLLSNATRELVEDELAADVRLRDLGEHRLKDIDRPEHLFQLDIEGLSSEFPALRTAPADAPFEGQEAALARAVEAAATPPTLRRRNLMLAALAGVLAAAIAIPVFALARGGGGGDRLEVFQANGVGILDPDSSRLVGEVEVGTTPTGVAADAEAVWVTNAANQTVTRVDPVTQTVRDTIPVGAGPTGIAVGGGSVWVANSLDGTVSRIDPKSNGVVEIIPVGNGPVAVAAGQGSVWIANRDDQTISEINPGTGRVRRTHPVGAGIVALAFGEGAVWAASETGGRLLRLDPQSGAVDPVNVGHGPTGVAVGFGSVWVVNGQDGTLSRVDPQTLSVTETKDVGDDASGVAAGDESIWVTTEHGSVARVDPADNSVDTIAVGGRPAGVAVSPHGVFVAVRPAGGAHRGGTLRALTQSPRLDSIDPALAYTPPSWSVLALAHDGLTAFRRVGGAEGSRIVPDLALSVPEPAAGGRAYTFRLRPGLRYSTGQPVRASDFRRALERVFALESSGRFFYDGIVGASACTKRPKRCDLSHGIVANDAARTVTFRLTTPDPELMQKLALPFASAVPRGAPRLSAITSPLPATGPYRVASHVPGRQLRLVRNPRFREWSHAAQPDGYADEIVVRLGVPEAKQTAQVESGAADLAPEPSSDDLERLRPLHSSQVKPSPTPNTRYLYLNVRSRPFDDVRVRRALNYAVDREQLVALSGGPDRAQVTCQILPPNFPGYRTYCPYTHDVARARRLVAASGTRGTSIVVWSSPQYEGPYEGPGWGAYFVEVLRALGYRARLKLVADDDHDAAIDPASNTQAGTAGWNADYIAPGGFIAPILSCAGIAGGGNSARFCDPAVEAAMQRAFDLQTTDPAAANAAWARVDRMITDRAPIVATSNRVSVDYVSERVGNYQYHPMWGPLLSQLWVR
jgi:YVTN family beta-propeller protein